MKECKAKIEVNGTTVEGKLKPDKKTAGMWRLSMKLKGVAIDPPNGNVDVTVAIGDDAGSATNVPVKLK